MPATTPLKFVSSVAFKALLTEKKDTKDIAILKSAPVLDDLTKAVDRAARTIDFVISTPAIDRDNDTIDVSGWDIGSYVKNPVVLFAHDHWQPPVAQSLSVTTDAGALRSKAFFTPKDLYPFGDMIFEFYAQGFMRATSVGYKPKEWKYNDDRKYGVDYTMQELLEYSCVPVPSNPEALMQARAKGIDVNPLKAWCERLLDDSRMLKEGNGQTREVIERIRALTVDGKTLFLHMNDMKMPGKEPEKDRCVTCGLVKESILHRTESDNAEIKAAAHIFTLKAVEEPEPEIKSTVQPLQQWGCKNATHTHPTKDAAELCEVRALLHDAIMSALSPRKLVTAEQLQEKVGRVLSAANETRLRSAATKGEEMAALIRDVLAQLEEPIEESVKKPEEQTDFFAFDATPDDGIDEDLMRSTMVQVLGDELRAQLRVITGRVD